MKVPDRTLIRNLVVREWRELVTIKASDRPWQMPFAAAIASGGPMLVAAAFDRVAEGVVAALAGLVFLYLPSTPMHHRMVTLMACAFGMISCFALGALSHLVPAARVPLITLCAILVTMVCRYYRVAAPGSLFFIMTAAIAAYSPGTLADALFRTGILAIGCINAVLIAFLYSLHILRRRRPDPIPAIQQPTYDYVWVDSVIIGLLVGLSLAVAQLLSLEKAYWVPVSCLAVLQGLSLRASWNRQVHRILGTGIGLGVTWVLLLVLKDGWTIAIAIILLTFLIETAVVRHYGFAAIFITPLTILLAEAPMLGDESSTGLIQARFIDTLLGAYIGFIGAVALHSPGFRSRFGRVLRRLSPKRLADLDQ
ncbi:FUSC family protein [Sphingosinicella humi]|uniref:FUSC family protein n=1 Tax=Allosphingosinicella humi TaxID=2068657 RepID=A0A2U2J3R9_9SPHN|nr:FUSC family protein [Sphingosinicella humi]PWG02975.1 FUSC family protein [Sphingosinicella humi]